MFPKNTCCRSGELLQVHCEEKLQDSNYRDSECCVHMCRSMNAQRKDEQAITVVFNDESF